MSIRKLILPENFVINRDYMGTFDNMETEVCARLIVRFLQERGQGWEPFSKKALDDWNAKRCPSDPSFHLQRLVGYWKGDYSPLRVDGDTVYIQDVFISRCASNPQLFASEQ